MSTPPKLSAALTTHHLIKLVALVIMTIDHIGAFVYPDQLWWRAVGRITFPVWFFLVGHALHYRVSPNLILWALVLAALNPLLGNSFFPINALMTILCCQLLLQQVEKRGWLQREPWTLCVGACALLFVTAPLMEYGSMGMLYALMGYAVRSKQMTWRTGKLVVVFALVLYLAMQLAMLDLTLVQQVFVVVLTTLTTLYLARFEHRPITLPMAMAGWQRALIWLSRHSLQYYVVHRVLLQALGLRLGALKFGLHWF
jgi:hypothetical protein